MQEECAVGTFLEERKRFGSGYPESAVYSALSDVTMSHLHRRLNDTNPVRAFAYSPKVKATATILGGREIDD